MEESHATHPSKYIVAASPLYKRRGRLTAAVKQSDWVERMFVLTTEGALFWFQIGDGLVVPRSEPIGTQHGRLEIRHVHSISPSERAGTNTTRPDELVILGPKYQLEVTTVLAGPEQTHVIGCPDKARMDAWLNALSRAVSHAFPNPTADGRLSVRGRPHSPEGVGGAGAGAGTGVGALLSAEVTGVLAMGYLGKAREGAMKGFKDGWSTRFVVLTGTTLIFYKREDKKAEAAE